MFRIDLCGGRYISILWKGQLFVDHTAELFDMFKRRHWFRWVCCLYFAHLLSSKRFLM